jgi:hypothetical protein
MYKTDTFNIFHKNTNQLLQLIVNNNTTSNKTYKIIYLTSFYSGDNWFGTGHELFKDCSFKNCMSLSDPHNYNNSDAALVSMRHISAMKQPFPKWRHPGQKWMMFMLESPEHKFLDYMPYNNFFNATITYKNISDIYYPYGELVRRATVVMKHSVDFKSKVKMAAWFVSNCHTVSKRELYVKELQKYIQIDIFGNCGTLSCPQNDEAQLFEIIEHNLQILFII